MWLLDTDHLTLLERGGSTALSSQLRMEQVLISEVGTTIVNYEEQMRGWLSNAARAKTPLLIEEAYAFLERHIETFRDLNLLSFGIQASKEFEVLHRAKIRIGTKDLRIAAVCLANNATLLTRNLKDFNRVPGLKAEDWSQ